MDRGIKRTLSYTPPQGRRVHVSWQIAGLSAGILAGIALAPTFALPVATSLGWLAAALALAAAAFSRHTRPYAMAAIVAGGLLGFYTGCKAQAGLQAYRQYYKHSVSLQGVVADDVSHGPTGDVRFELKSVQADGRPLPGKVWISATPPGTGTIKRSDTVTVHGKLSPGFGNLPASISPAAIVRLSPTSHNDLALRFRDWFAAGIRRAVPEPAASLGSGFLVGQHSDLPGKLADELKAVGLTHAVVASGSNLTILIAFTRKLFGRASKYAAAMGGALMTAGFMLVTGFSPSMTRAGLVTGLSLAAWYYGRRINPLVLIPFAAAITALANPSYLWGDIGWYLSFGSFAGVLVLAPLIQSYFWGGRHKPGLLLEIFIGTTAAQLATLPVILFSFGTLSNYALLANLLVLPLIPLAMALAFGAGLAGAVLPIQVAHLVGIPANLVMEYMLKVIHWIANLPGAQGHVSFGSAAVCGSYALLIVGIIYMWRRTAYSFGHETSVLIGERP